MGVRKKILIVEDDADVRNFLARRIQSWGYDAMTAPDGVTGLEMARRECPKAIVLDLKLPKMAGEEVCKAIREDGNKLFSTTPIIMLTGKTDDVDRVIGRVIGANVYMTKPFRDDALQEQVVRYAGANVDVELESGNA